MADSDTALADLLTLTQWLSPSFPLGAFAYSHGLETAIARGDIRDAASLADWLSGVLRFGSAAMDAALLCRAMAPEADPDALAAEAEALCSGQERWIETRDQGAAFARTVSALRGRALPALPLPVAVGTAAADLTLPPATVAALYLQSFVGNLVLVAVRLVPLGQTEGQSVLQGLADLVQTVSARAAEQAHAETDDPIGTAAFGSDLAAMQHETDEVRLFRT